MLADLLNAQWKAPKSRTGRLWKIVSIHGGMAHLMPLDRHYFPGFAEPSALLNGGGVKMIRRPIREVQEKWEKVP